MTTPSIDAILNTFYHPGLKTIDPGLDRVEAFLALLGNPQHKLPPVIHIAGTNGKGSLVAYLQAIFEAANYKVHRYTSPHLVRFNERIVIAGKEIENSELETLLKTVQKFLEKQPVTFFEATTAAAFLAFSQSNADIVLLETGMGGRLDATNVLPSPLLTAITPVALDHCEYLGSSLGVIAAEKAGIIKKMVPCVVGKQDKEAADAIKLKAAQMPTSLYRHGQEWQVMRRGKFVTYQSAMRTLFIRPALVGEHQYDNAATAVACIDQLTAYAISDHQIQQGISTAQWQGRLQRLDKHSYQALLPGGMELWLDGSHNPHGGVALAQWLQSNLGKDVHLICAMVKGKDTEGYLRSLAHVATQLHAIAIPDEALSQTAEQVEAAAKAASIPAKSYGSIENALQTIALHAKTPCIVCICGSLYLAGKVLAQE